VIIQLKAKSELRRI